MSDGAYLLFAAALMVVSLLVRAHLKRVYAKWGSIGNLAGLSGAQTARAILNANGLGDVGLEAVKGQLDDHYDPRTKIVRLSDGVYSVRSVAALSIAGHEAGHALQDQARYRPMVVKEALVPLANAGARFGMPAALIGWAAGSSLLVQIGVLGYVGALVLQFVTLPIEFDASARAQSELERLNLIRPSERAPVRSMLRAAALTYVAGAASSAVYLVYLMLSFARVLFRRPLG
jgi:Zn-dependent membrane protease YugP